ncbi:MAG: di-trans,poly-cis-decaprenylcistransferase [Nanoarchaeota archaeon]|nr:di-trans,poly-cis-decaprenylcistransferase [Nanoarchaeota archaeon]MBU1704908.1 di-trans,poly-cis-decaprenylcistransferase [Nanoarchaeota archaeon]
MHIAIILDGNRRWAKNHGKPTSKGHEQGFNKIKKLMEWAKELSIKEITLYCFSTENFNREKHEVDSLFDMFRKKIVELKKKDSVIHKNEVSIRFVGKLDMFPNDMQERMKELMDETDHYDKYILNLAMAYGGKLEIVEAVKKVIEKGVDVSEDSIKKNLFMADDVDLMIRPGGEKRLSNFLLWQASYAELYFTDTLWPDFSKEDLISAISWFKTRDRRFGE